MNKYFFINLLVFLISFSGRAQKEVYQLSLIDVIELAKEQSPSAKVAETRKKNYYWQYRSFRANYNPSLNLEGNIPGFNRDYIGNRLDDGTIVYQERRQLSSGLELGLRQPISLTGGTISINSNLNQFNDLDKDFKQYNSTWFNVMLNQPIFGFNNLKWDKKIEPLRYEESKKSYVEEMESISREVVDRFFDYLDAQINLQIARFNQANNDTVYNIERGRYNIGTTSKEKLLQVELQLLRSKQDVTQAQLDRQTSRLNLRRYIGINDSSSTNLELLLPEELPLFDVELEKALVYAQQNRADFIQFERRRAEANRDVARARSQRFQTNLSASFGLNNASSAFKDTYLVDPNNQQRVNVTLSMPIVDWGRSKARMQTALANQELAQYLLAQDIQNFEQEIITLVSQFEVLRYKIEITKKSNEIAQERYDAAQKHYLLGITEITDLNIALEQKDEAKRSYINTLRSFWIAYFDLRRLTLYDFIKNEVLYTETD